MKTPENTLTTELAKISESPSRYSQGVTPGFGTRLKIERRRLGKTQASFGEIGGVGRLAQCQYEQEKTEPSLGYLDKIGGAGVDLVYLILAIRMPGNSKSE